jgi:hypothetical protein
MKKILLSMLVICSFSLNAAPPSLMQCNGFDNLGYRINLTADIKADIINVNGKILRVVGKTWDGQGVFTENYINSMGVFVYLSLIPKGQTSLLINQFNATTQVLLANGLLSCNFSSIKKVSDHPLFK